MYKILNKSFFMDTSICNPVPIIVGIEKADCKFIQDHCEILFIDLDQTPIVFLNKSEFMKNHDRDIIPLVSADFMDSLINLMNPYYSQDQIKRDQEMQILKHLEEFYRQKIIHNLPQTPIFNSRSLKDCSKTLYDYDKMSNLVLNNLSQQGTQDKFLWSQFLKTQIFMQFIDQYYRKK
ncbi:hypothetical protein pb186bvf_010753 [Paramecium bursaria]